jgi:hypothetical protein
MMENLFLHSGIWGWIWVSKQGLCASSFCQMMPSAPLQATLLYCETTIGSDVENKDIRGAWGCRTRWSVGDGLTVKDKSRLMTKKRIRKRQPVVRFPSLDPPPRPTGHSLTAASQCHTHVTSSYARAIETHAAHRLIVFKEWTVTFCSEEVRTCSHIKKWCSIEILEVFARYFWFWNKIKY